MSPANVTLPPPLAADASLGREDLFRMMLVGAGGAGAAACLLLFVVEPPRCSWRCCCDGGTAAADMVGIGMTLGMVMSVRSGAGPASTESTGTLTRLGIADGRIGWNYLALPRLLASMKVAWIRTDHFAVAS